jgi:hypothetical protein
VLMIKLIAPFVSDERGQTLVMARARALLKSCL